GRLDMRHRQDVADDQLHPRRRLGLHLPLHRAVVDAEAPSHDVQLEQRDPERADRAAAALLAGARPDVAVLPDPGFGYAEGAVPADGTAGLVVGAIGLSLIQPARDVLASAGGGGQVASQKGAPFFGKRERSRPPAMVPASPAP